MTHGNANSGNRAATKRGKRGHPPGLWLVFPAPGPMPVSQATAGMPGTDAARKSQHARQLDVNLFSDVEKIRLRDRDLTSEKILTCYRPDPGPEAPGRCPPRDSTS